MENHINQSEAETKRVRREHIKEKLKQLQTEDFKDSEGFSSNYVHELQSLFTELSIDLSVLVGHDTLPDQELDRLAARIDEFKAFLSKVD